MVQAAARPAVLPEIAVSITQAIAAFAVETPAGDLPAGARHVLRLSMLDWLAVAAAAVDEPVSRIVRGVAAREGGLGEASVIGLAARLPARAAALVNATTGHALDYDDTHFLHVGHPTTVVLPAALAIAEATGADGDDLLAAALIGVESACRIGHWLGRRHYDLGFHQTATSGAFGAAMAAARLLGLDAGRACHALSIAATRASGLKSQFATMGKPYNAGIASANGVEAARLAEAGFVSRVDGLECSQGFADTHAGEAVGLDTVLDGLGRSFVFEAVQHKFHACCHGLHAALEALARVRDDAGLAPDDVARVWLAVNPRWLGVCNIAAPATALEAKFSYRLAAAMVLAGRDTAALSAFTDAVCRDRELCRLRDRIEVAGAAHLPDTAATAVIELASGGAIEAGHDLAAPLDPAVREARVRAKAATLLGEARAQGLWRRIEALSAARPPVDWGALLRA